ncbi:MAG TPA: SAM-dependent methyltransferase [Acidimicrobiia bacterium]|jgi:tRNA (Thr-GGU) A37 N-methylase
MDPITMQPLGTVRGGRTTSEDDDWGGLTCRIELDPAVVTTDATLGLDQFSHAEVVFVFDGVDPAQVCNGARHPRGRTDWPLTGILAQRAKDRPNRIGSTVCRLVSVDGHTIEVEGLDAMDGTPVLDVKPYMLGFAARGEVREPAWATELMSTYW